MQNAKVHSNIGISVYLQCTRVSTVIYQFHYIDKDRGRNAEVHFNLSTVGSSAAKLIHNTFNISEDGKLLTRSLFDVSKHKTYTVSTKTIELNRFVCLFGLLRSTNSISVI